MSESFKRNPEGSKNIIKNNATSVHKKQLYAMTRHELLDKPVWQRIGEELLFLAQHGKMHDEGEGTIKSSAKEQKHFVYGLAGFARLFGCSLPTANRIKQSGKIDRAITQIGRKSSLTQNLLSNSQGAKSEDTNKPSNCSHTTTA